jgi:hypothetical protein
MQICPNCDHENLEGVLFCEACGVMLSAYSAAETSKLDEAGGIATSVNWGTATFDEQTSIIFHIENFSNPLIIHAPEEKIILGRQDQEGGAAPTVDLTPFGALEKGVSRQHALIERLESNVMLVDLGSRNATYLNGQQVNSSQPRLLRDGDEIRLGALSMRVFFRKNTRPL